MKKKTRCYIYTRVSTAIQVDGYSLDAQKDKLRKYAEFQDMEIVGEYSDEGHSGKNIKGRQKFMRMLNDIEDGKDGVDFVLVFKLSRFGRNAADVLSSLQLMQDYGVNLICVEDGIDSSKEAGKLLISIIAVSYTHLDVYKRQLLALREKEYGFNLNQLTGDTLESNTDGAILYQYLEKNLQRAKVAPEVKKQRVLNQFTLIKDRPQLNTKRQDLGDKTPLKYFAEYINNNIFQAIISNGREDYLGRFYGEFVSYSGGDGQALGVVLTPRHITELFCELVDLKPTDIIFDPCCGTGGFLISGMHKMLRATKNDTERKHIKQQQIHGIEIRDDMFSIATTNMILRGDGQSNLICEDFLAQDPGELQLKGGGITVGFMNPPYSQAKGKDTANLSELCFIRHLLNSITTGGRAAVIVPVSAMIGKTKEDKAVKQDILKKHTLEGVISLNKDTFYRVGTVPCIAVFTAGEPHPADKIAKFINFEDDGFEVKKHLGLVETERAKDKRQYLLDCWRGKVVDFPSSFMVETTVEDTDEWLHSFYYYNDEIPTEEDFMNSIADYLTFEFNMVTHGKGYLFGQKGGDGNA